MSIDPRESEKRVTAIFPPHTLLYLSRLDEQLKGLTPNNQASTKREMEISGGEDRESGPPQWMWMCNTSWCQQRRYVDIEPIITQTAWRHVMESRRRVNSSRSCNVSRHDLRMDNYVRFVSASPRRRASTSLSHKQVSPCNKLLATAVSTTAISSSQNLWHNYASLLHTYRSFFPLRTDIFAVYVVLPSPQDNGFESAPSCCSRMMWNCDCRS